MKLGNDLFQRRSSRSINPAEFARLVVSCLPRLNCELVVGGLRAVLQDCIGPRVDLMYTAQKPCSGCVTMISPLCTWT